MKIRQMGKLEKTAFSPTVIPGIYCIKLSAPISVQYEITAECNQGCIFCYNVWKDKKGLAPETLSLEKRELVVEKIISLEVFEVILSGGEPLLIPEICKIISKLTKKNIRTYLITNGSLLSKELCSRLKDSGIGGIQISLHGSNAKINDAITQRPGSFNAIIEGTKNAISVFTPEIISINTVLIKQNYNDIKSLMKMLKSIGIIHYSLGFLSKTGAALSINIDIDKNQILQAFRTMIETGREISLEVGISGGFPLCIFPPDEQKQIMHIAANTCDAGLNQLVISPNGDIRPCVCFPQILGNILKDDPKKVWNTSPFLKSLQRFEHIPPACYKCNLVAICKGGCRASAYCTYGYLQATDPILNDKEERKNVWIK